MRRMTKGARRYLIRITEERVREERLRAALRNYGADLATAFRDGMAAIGALIAEGVAEVARVAREMGLTSERKHP